MAHKPTRELLKLGIVLLISRVCFLNPYIDHDMLYMINNRLSHGKQQIKHVVKALLRKRGNYDHN